MRSSFGVFAAVLGLGALIVGGGMGVEWLRRRATRNWAESIGGTFEAGGLIEGVPVPEGAAFDAGLRDDAYSYRNVVRVQRGGASYVVATYTLTTTFAGKSKTRSHAVALATCPGRTFPPIGVSPPLAPFSPEFAKLAGFDPNPPPPEFPDLDERFAARFLVHTLPGAARPSSDAVADVFSDAVRERLLATEDLVGYVTLRGDVVRIEAIDRTVTYPYEELFALAESLVGAWRR
jgi:hypothetical protein